MGRVFRATDLKSGAPVALKVLGERGRAERFSVEAEAISSLEHEAIVRYVDHGVSDEGEPFLVMEWLDGQGLDVRIARKGLSLHETLDLAAKIVGALEYIHGRGVVHRDLKPSNIVLMTEDVRSAKLVDFGIARIASSRAITATGLRLGTLFYMAPEQYFHPRHVDGRADVFALGCIVFECLAGRRAFVAEDEIAAFARVVLDQAPPLRQVRAQIPEPVSALVQRLLTRDQTQRPHADGALRAALVALRADVDDTPPLRPLRTLGDVPATEVEALQTTVEPRTQRISAPPPSALPAALPRLPRRLIGRDEELAHLEALLGAAGGVVTLWGPAGIGKTRLALEVAHRWPLAEEPRVVAFANLRDAADDDAILRAVAQALRPTAPPAGTGAEIEGATVRVLCARGAVLVVLDGAEHVGATLAATLARWTAVATEARFLVTSREKARDGVVVEMGPLASAGGESPAALLFRERAGASGRIPSDPAAGQMIARIVRALDGNPLAIELAAARLEVLGLGPLLERLSRPLDVLRGGSSAPIGSSIAPLTMAEALAWSWSLLADDERVALARCSAFRGSFTVQAAEAVLGWDPRVSVLDLLQSLRDKSLLTSTLGPTTTEARLSMSGAIREFAREKLDELGLAESTLDRHAEYFVRMGTPLAQRVAARGDVAALRALAAEIEELIGAAVHLIARRAPLALPALLVLDPVLTTRGPFGKHPAMLDEAIAMAEEGSLAGAVEPGLLARVRQARGRVLSRLGRHDAARVDLEYALGEAKRVGDPAGEASATMDLGILHHMKRDLDAARRCYEAVALRDTDDEYIEARALGNLGALHHDQGRFDDAYACYVEAIAIFESLADPRPLGLFLANLAMLDHDRGRLADAARRFARALEHLEEAADPRLLGIALGSLGMLELQLGKLASALERHREAQALLQEVNDPRSEALCFGRLGATLATLDRLEEANAAVTKGERLARRDPVAKDTLRLLRAFVDAATARAAFASGNAHEMLEALDAARARVREACEPRDGQGALVDHSDDARAALSALRPLLHGLEQDARPAAEAAGRADEGSHGPHDR
jgi:predicted ATPase